MRWLLGRGVRKQCLRRVVEQGFARHCEADTLALVAEELGALSALLGNRPFLFGEAPHAVDASAFGVLDQLAARDFNPGLADLVERHANLVGPPHKGLLQVWALHGWRGMAGGHECASC